MKRLAHTTLVTFLLLFACTRPVIAGTTGKISGRATDKETDEGLPSVNILIAGTSLGGVTDPEGYFNIINVPAGRYEVRFRLVGYTAFASLDVLVTADKTTIVNASLEEATVEGEEIIVTAERPIVDVKLTSSLVTLTDQEIAALPVQELNDIVGLQAGVINSTDGLHFRGGRVGEVQYQVDGVSVNNSFNNESGISIDRSLIQEVQVISGTFDAEYGQAMSGVVNTVLKTGREQLAWNAEIYTGDFHYSGNPCGISYSSHPFSTRNYQLSLSGPLGLPATTFIVSGRRYVFDDYVYGERRFLPTDRSDFENHVYHPTGDGEEVALGWLREWSGLAKISNRSLGNVEVGYQIIVNSKDSRETDYAWRYNPDGLSQESNLSLIHGLDLTHTLSGSTFYNFSIRQNIVDYTDFLYSDLYDPRYDSAGAARSDMNYEDGAIIQGADFTRYIQKTNSGLFKGALTSQVAREHLMKLGGEVQVSDLKFGSPGHLVFTTVDGVEQLVRYEDQPPDYLPIQTYYPLSMAFYAQDQIDRNELTVRAGARVDYFHARTVVPGDLANPANSIEGAPVSKNQRTTAKVTVAPRLGIAYQTGENASVFFSYGHFYQMPALGVIFSNSNYEVLEQLQADDPFRFGVFGNPDIKPEQTVHYEFGYKHAIGGVLGVNLNMFYKDIRNLLGVEFIETYTGAEYVRFTNVDFGNVFGFTVALDQRRIGILSSTVDYTLSITEGNSSDPKETSTRAAAGEDPRPRQIPLNWDQRHVLNATIQLSQPQDYSASVIFKFGSGQPYTPELTPGFGGSIEPNSGRKPNGLIVDLRGEKFFSLLGARISIFARVLNLFDAKYNNGFVFTDTGSPDYSLTPEADAATLGDPTRYYQPRKIELGITINSTM